MGGGVGARISGQTKQRPVSSEDQLRLCTESDPMTELGNQINRHVRARKKLKTRQCNLLGERRRSPRILCPGRVLGEREEKG